jgi:hypothetical protein
VTGAKGEALNIRIVNAGEGSFPTAWPHYNACASYDRKYWFRVPSAYDPATGVLSFQHTPEHVSRVARLLLSECPFEDKVHGCWQCRYASGSGRCSKPSCVAPTASLRISQLPLPWVHLHASGKLAAASLVTCELVSHAGCCALRLLRALQLRAAQRPCRGVPGGQA